LRASFTELLGDDGKIAAEYPQQMQKLHHFFLLPRMRFRFIAVPFPNLAFGEGLVQVDGIDHDLEIDLWLIADVC
jgi:hypothetical protein